MEVFFPRRSSSIIYFAFVLLSGLAHGKLGFYFSSCIKHIFKKTWFSLFFFCKHILQASLKVKSWWLLQVMLPETDILRDKAGVAFVDQCGYLERNGIVLIWRMMMTQRWSELGFTCTSAHFNLSFSLSVSLSLLVDISSPRKKMG